MQGNPALPRIAPAHNVRPPLASLPVNNQLVEDLITRGHLQQLRARATEVRVRQLELELKDARDIEAEGRMAWRKI